MIGPFSMSRLLGGQNCWGGVIGLVTWILGLGLAVLGQAQPLDSSRYELLLHKSVAPIRLDGVLDEPAWQEAPVADRFFQNFPYDTSFAVLGTSVRVTFDAQFLYVGAVVQQAQEDYIVSSLKRDFSGGSSDVFVVNIDPSQDKLTGFHFAVSPLNVQREGLIDNGVNIPLDWDNKWYSAVKNEPTQWVVEMAIPFKTLRYPAGQSVWRINFGRNSLKQNEVSSWVPVPRQFRPNNLAFTGRLRWPAPPPPPGLNASFIPYLIARTEKDQEFRLPVDNSSALGFDAKIALTPSLNLDLTVNPDFSQVEVDRQITNLSRFELFFPERRQFFLENEDLFSRFGFPDSRPFFSRRIGLANGLVTRVNTDGDTIAVQRNVNVPIQGGFRLSGKLDQNWRIGLLNMQTARVDAIQLNPANYTVGVLQRKIFDRSTIGAIVVNKENFEPRPEGGFALDKQAYNRVVGLEYNLYSKDNKWESEVYYHRSIVNGNNRDAQSAAWFMGYFTKRWNVFLANQYIGARFRADAGFIPRRDVFSSFQQVRHLFFPKTAKLAQKVNVLGIGLENNLAYTASNFGLTDRSHFLTAFVEFPGSGEFSLRFGQDYTYLFFPFDPTNAGGEPLPQGSSYTYYSGGLTYRSDQRKLINYELQLSTGQYFNGRLFQVNGAVSYRWQPVGSFALAYTYNDINLPSPYNQASFWLVGPRAELSFSRNLFFSTFLQYNTQVNNVNINSRLQWRFKPVSDLFLVYTDNYFTEQFFTDPQAKNRALVLKVTYWLNL